MERISKRFAALKAKSDRVNAQIIALNGRVSVELKKAESLLAKAEKTAATKAKDSKGKKGKTVRVHSYSRVLSA
jgi:hypothetical protein